MAKRRKTTPEEEAALDKRAKEFRELLEKRKIRDEDPSRRARAPFWLLKVRAQADLPGAPIR